MCTSFDTFFFAYKKKTKKIYNLFAVFKLSIFFFFFVVNILVNGLAIIVNVEFLLVLADVFTSALEDTDITKTVPETVEILAEASKVTTELSTKAAAASKKRSPDLIVILQVEEPEIVLLADAKQKDTDALILKVSL